MTDRSRSSPPFWLRCVSLSNRNSVTIQRPATRYSISDLALRMQPAGVNRSHHVANAYAIFICLFALAAVCEPTARYEVATIIKVKAHKHKADGTSSKPASYDISLKVADAIYTALYTDAVRCGA